VEAGSGPARFGCRATEVKRQKGRTITNKPSRLIPSVMIKKIIIKGDFGKCELMIIREILVERNNDN
jgi:hypothetical protein